MRRSPATFPSVFLTSAVISILLSGAIFGFFYAWVCSTMWGLDAADPRVAIAAMQAMNASVRNAVFFPAFFLTPVALGATALLARSEGRHRAAPYFLAAAVLYAGGALLLTGLVNVPMNEALGSQQIPSDPAAAASIWADYSPRWQAWNMIRTVVSGLTLTLGVLGLIVSADRRSPEPGSPRAEPPRVDELQPGAAQPIEVPSGDRRGPAPGNRRDLGVAHPDRVTVGATLGDDGGVFHGRRLIEGPDAPR